LGVRFQAADQMLPDHNERHDGDWSSMRPHEEFLELCAVSTTGELTGDEQARLKEHLATCAECREALHEFEAAANIGAPLLSSVFAPTDLEGEKSTNGEVPIANRQASSQEAVGETGAGKVGRTLAFAHRNENVPTQVNWNYVWLSLAAAVLLTVALGLYSYEAGTRHAAPAAQVQAPPPNDTGKIDSLEQQLSDAGHEREVLRGELVGRDHQIAELQRQIAAQTSALNDAKATQAGLARSLQSAVNDKQQISQQQAVANQSLATAQASLLKVQAELAATHQQQDQDEGRTGKLELQIASLNDELKQSESTVEKQTELLDDDRDIRDLMGARDLYIAEVYDVARDGATQKPYGRIFYTKGKSLVFYAYDLDQQPGVRNAATFQAWGQNGPDQQQALSLGVFYQDNGAKKRWVLKSDDPHTLEQINAVFVTVEPNGGSHKPTGRPLLFASLRIEPNHP